MLQFFLSINSTFFKLLRISFMTVYKYAAEWRVMLCYFKFNIQSTGECPTGGKAHKSYKFRLFIPFTKRRPKPKIFSTFILFFATLVKLCSLLTYVLNYAKKIKYASLVFNNILKSPKKMTKIPSVLASGPVGSISPISILSWGKWIPVPPN